MSGHCCFPGFVILSVRMHLTACLTCVLFGHDYPAKASRVKNLFSQPFRARPSAASYFRAHGEGKKKKIDPSHESVRSFHFSTWPKLGAIFS